ncbi:MAG: class I tRNA ligase family protein [Candidatus Yanofskybacteria bacterium]|nr:class I tRNA ligase family protein [Candidatus Yanofskybacteria bacterium]
MAGFDFKKIEQKILDFWEQHNTFEKSLSQRNPKKRFVFYEGPPTANGKPGVHHMEARSFKDLYGRYKTMQGMYVLRKAGWDTHGLPVELEVEKELGFKNKKDIEAYGIDKFNRKAKESVWKYKQEWEEMTKRMGYWVDLDHPYITYETPYIESIWAILKHIHNKELLYQAHRVVPFCTRCGTPLSSHEVAQGYKLVKENSVYLKFKLKSDKVGSDTYILSWTTTPWTLPGNVALAVGKDIEYVVAEQNGEQFILAKDLLKPVLGEAEIIKELRGAELEGLEYEPLFDVPQLKSEKSYRVYPADFVTTTDGTGVVHTAVMYGEDDYELGTKLGLPKVHTVDEQGKFVGVSNELNGKYVKARETEKLIIEHLQKNGNLLKEAEYEHDYPFCWRCDTPLLYYAKTSWFIKMSSVNKQLLENNEKVNWIPEHLKEGRFGQWLKEGKDWALSRERYWGTPLPIWKCVKCEALRAVGSVEELTENNVGSGNTYYVMRHGLTTREELSKQIISSRLETDTYHLTEEGKEHAKASAEKLAALESIDVIYSSPFLRTKETAEIAGRVFHQEVQLDERLKEIGHAMECESKSPELCPVVPRVNFDSKEEGGESRNDVRRRFMDFMREMESTHKNKKILIVSHGDPIWLFSTMGAGMTEQEISAAGNTRERWFPDLASIHQLNWKDLPRNEQGELDLHRPFIDEVALKCGSCNADMHRIPDLIDVWFDSGAMPYAQWHWPFEESKIFEQQFPADFITEAVDQTRGWFYTLLAIGTLLEKGNPYRNVISLGHVLDDKGKKMSKSKGNVVAPNELMDAVGVDAARWYFYTVNPPGEPKLFKIQDVQDRLRGFIMTLYNCMRFFELYKSEAPTQWEAKHLLDKWILSRLNAVLLEVTTSLDAYDPTIASRALEKFVVDDFSNWWLRRSRKRSQAHGLLRHLLIEIAKMSAPFIPFTAEEMYLNLRNNEMPESVHLEDWSEVAKRAITAKLEEHMKRVQEIVTAGLALRKEKQLKVRQPLQSITVVGGKLDKDLEELVKDELNVKEVKYSKKGELTFDYEINQELQNEGYAREVMRQIQDMRKEAGYQFDEKVLAHWHSDDKELTDAITHWSEQIQKETVLSDFVNSAGGTLKLDVEKEFELAPTKKIWLGVKK